MEEEEDVLMCSVFKDHVFVNIMVINFITNLLCHSRPLVYLTSTNLRLLIMGQLFVAFFGNVRNIFCKVIGFSTLIQYVNVSSCFFTIYF